MAKTLVTGASGFVGAALCSDLHARGFAVRGAVRSLHSFFPASGVEPVAVGNLDAATDWSSALAGVGCVIHCAARAHVMHETEADALAPADPRVFPNGRPLVSVQSRTDRCIADQINNLAHKGFGLRSPLMGDTELLHNNQQHSTLNH